MFWFYMIYFFFCLISGEFFVLCRDTWAKARQEAEQKRDGDCQIVQTDC